MKPGLHREGRFDRLSANGGAVRQAQREREGRFDRLSANGEYGNGGPLQIYAPTKSAMCSASSRGSAARIARISPEW
jgi:hypothetical protein